MDVPQPLAYTASKWASGGQGGRRSGRQGASSSSSSSRGIFRACTSACMHTQLEPFPSSLDLQFLLPSHASTHPPPACRALHPRQLLVCGGGCQRPALRPAGAAGELPARALLPRLRAACMHVRCTSSCLEAAVCRCWCHHSSQLLNSGLVPPPPPPAARSAGGCCLPGSTPLGSTRTLWAVPCCQGCGRRLGC